MQAGVLGLTLLAILGVFSVLAFVICRVEGLALFAPKSSKHLADPAGTFCTSRCRMANGHCPLTGSTEPAADCPLWRFVAADQPTRSYGSPFEHLRLT